MISLENVSASYSDGVKVLHDISLELPDDRNVCILGNNGSGKTTLLRTIAGVIKYSGHAGIDGKELSTLSRRDIAGKVSLMSQMSDVYFSYTVYETVMMGRYIHNKSIFGAPGIDDVQKVMKCMEDTGVLDIKDRQISGLSGGQLQRVLLARTFAQDTHIILLDEPTNHLDLKYQAELMKFLKTWSSVSGNMFVGVFHDIALAAEAADDIVYMKNGRISGYGRVNEMLERDLMAEVYGIDVEAEMKKKYALWG